MRNKLGQFVAGYSGNTGGRPKDEHRVAELARSFTAEAIETLVNLMRTAKDERVRGTAAQAILDRGWGKPKTEISLEKKQDYFSALITVNERLQE